MRAPRYLPRHPRALEALRAVREGLDLAAVLGDDTPRVLGSLTRGCRPPAVRRDESGLRLTTRGRELLALAGLPLLRERGRTWVTWPLGATTRALLTLLSEAPRTTEEVAAAGVSVATLGAVARSRLVERVNGKWTLSERGVETLRAGVCVSLRKRRVTTVVIGGAG